MNMPFKVKIVYIFTYYLMYRHLYDIALNLDVAFLLSVSIFLLLISQFGYLCHRLTMS